MRRFAIYSDIHGNALALEAVFADIAEHGVSERYCLGDLVGYGPRPAEVVARVRSLGDPVVRGNYDDGVGARRGGCGCYYATEAAKEDGAASYAFTDAALSDADHAWLAALPDAVEFEAEGVQVRMAHGSPRKINEYLLLDRDDEFLGRLAEEAGADLICVGHVHIPYHRAVRTPSGRIAHWISSGSVGKPKDGDPRACWVEVVIGTAEEVDQIAPNDDAVECAGGAAWVGTRVHRVEYDIDAVADEMRASGLPSRLAEALRLA